MRRRSSCCLINFLFAPLFLLFSPRHRGYERDVLDDYDEDEDEYEDEDYDYEDYDEDEDADDYGNSYDEDDED